MDEERSVRRLFVVGRGGGVGREKSKRQKVFQK